MLTIERKEEFYIIKKDKKVILECFEKIKPDRFFDGYYLGFSAEKLGEVVLFSRRGEFIYKFAKTRGNVGVSQLLDEIVGSQNIIQSMKKITSANFWGDKEIALAVRKKHADLNKRRMAACKHGEQYDVLYDIEKAAIEKFLCGKRAVKIARESLNRQEEKTSQKAVNATAEVSKK